jgi:hypothetical protein
MAMWSVLSLLMNTPVTRPAPEFHFTWFSFLNVLAIGILYSPQTPRLWSIPFDFTPPSPQSVNRSSNLPLGSARFFAEDVQVNTVARA